MSRRVLQSHLSVSHAIWKKCRNHRALFRSQALAKIPKRPCSLVQEVNLALFVVGWFLQSRMQSRRQLFPAPAG